MVKKLYDDVSNKFTLILQQLTSIGKKTFEANHYFSLISLEPFLFAQQNFQE
jgi:hypothetical protein